MVKTALGFFLNFHIAIILAILLAINSNMVNLLLANAIYEQLALRYSALGHRLSVQVTRAGHLTVDLSHTLEDSRLLCLSLSQLVTMVNNYLGLRLFGVVLVTILHCFMKVHILFTYQNQAIQLPIPRAILVIPDEVIQIIYLTVTADSLVDESASKCVLWDPGVLRV
ncbi:hypothetical protein J6590_063818 [Homalodisca vitripennis]|nr:hypothetical protein J6590_063818 [Homalodisca vitripennis]